MVANKEIRFRLIAISVAGGSMNTTGELVNGHTATVRMEINGLPVSSEFGKETVGPIDAVFNAIFIATGCSNVNLSYFHIKSIGPGIDAVGRATIELQRGSYFFDGESESENVIFAAGESLVVALNKMVNYELCSRVTRIRPFEEGRSNSNSIPAPIITIKGYKYEMSYEVDTKSSTSLFWLKYAMGSSPPETLRGSGKCLGLIKYKTF
jgi:LeuA allosteric (dimerisation) domain